MVRVRGGVRRSSRFAIIVLIVALSSWGCGFRPIGGHHPGAPRGVQLVTLLDNLGDATTASRIAEEGRDGYSIAFDQSVGLLFHIERPTVLKEVGGFVQSLASYQPEPADVIVEIHPTLADGRPDRLTVLASAPVSDQQDPKFITYQLARFNTFLRPGDYYALFALAVQQPPAIQDGVAVGGGQREISPGQFVPWHVPHATGGVTHPENYDPSVQQLRAPFDIAQLIRGVLVPRDHDDCRAEKWKALTDEHGNALRHEEDCDRVGRSLWWKWAPGR